MFSGIIPCFYPMKTGIIPCFLTHVSPNHRVLSYEECVLIWANYETYKKNFVT